IGREVAQAEVSREGLGGQIDAHLIWNSEISLRVLDRCERACPEGDKANSFERRLAAARDGFRAAYRNNGIGVSQHRKTPGIGQADRGVFSSSLLGRQERKRALALDVEILDNDSSRSSFWPEPEGNSAQLTRILPLRLVGKNVAVPVSQRERVLLWPDAKKKRLV